ETPSTDEGELGDKSLGAYLQQITLLTDADNDNDENADVVKLMTIHAAKGLEFPVVFSVGLEENLFPSTLSINTREELEEERRLFYVAITRAKSRLWLTYANSRYRFGSLVQNEPSRFLEEMPEQFIDRSYAGGGAMRNTFGGGGGLWNNGGGSNMFDRMQKKTPAAAASPTARSAPRPASAPAATHVP